jgi:hypothetical protein
MDMKVSVSNFEFTFTELLSLIHGHLFPHEIEFFRPTTSSRVDPHALQSYHLYFLVVGT